MMTSCGDSFAAMALSSFATASGCSSASLSTRMARSAPSASAVRSVSWQAPTPHDTATISLATPFSLSRTASSTAISSNGFIDILTLAVSTPLPSGFTRTLTLKSTTRLTETRIFIGGPPSERGKSIPRPPRPRSAQVFPQEGVGKRTHVRELPVVRRAAVAAFDVLVVEDVVPRFSHLCRHLARVRRVNAVVSGRGHEERRRIGHAGAHAVIGRERPDEAPLVRLVGVTVFVDP